MQLPSRMSTRVTTKRASALTDSTPSATTPCSYTRSQAQQLGSGSGSSSTSTGTGNSTTRTSLTGSNQHQHPSNKSKAPSDDFEEAWLVDNQQAPASTSSLVVATPPLPPKRSNSSTTTTTTTMINSRRPPPQPTTSASTHVEYRVDRYHVDGVEREVLTIEDTPEPVPSTSRHNGNGNGTANYSHAPSSSNPAYLYPHPPPAQGLGSSSTNATYYSNDIKPNANGVGAGTTNKRRRNNELGAYVDDHQHDYAARAPPHNLASGTTTTTTTSSSRTAAAPRYKQPPPPGAPTTSSKNALSSSVSRKRKLDEVTEPTADKDGHFIIVPGNKIIDAHTQVSYTIDRSLGQGTFGKVVAAKSSATNEMVAVKVIRAIPKYREAAKVEINVLKRLAFSDPHNQHQCIHMLSSFDFRDHTCIVSELLSVSVFDFLKDNGYAPFPFSHVQSFARQLLKSVDYVHKEHFIHTDLKPENILLEERAAKCIDNPFNPKHKTRRILKNSKIRLIDFGSATKQTEYHATVVSTRHYRAPEIILGLDWSFPCDVWSIGCILVEFVTGEALFQTHENLEHLAMMERVFGKMPPALAVSALNKEKKNMQSSREKNKVAPDVSNWLVEASGASRGTYRVNFPTAATAKQSKRFVEGMRSLERTVKDACAYAYDDVATNKAPLVEFIDLLRQLLQWDPAHRIEVKDALKHPFLTVEIKDDVMRAWGTNTE
ncbi:CMGC/CLK protein kinase [Microbotryum lychnidis-dioicae p1A1 Lamole]|uniref:CMGC/CLK protein kinase n=1 Tax=Microbotryum lychnidis-dioicae (strain p1A1 Lamole / MvSl-1064) TaxID=683840 RepID=U5H902_USTV1|nr:CMGC/CLK protein kinase [Microbotryum lychnidis-dioicae p1A1 Lamole]|eukprot:KDE06015.1 CMGC/CLK protein kinase [Microbotryum lychnidis-dioicae p1A1 Lamole]